ncbi:MAG TPA: hypothetical protein VFR07_04375 [Mycobacteriales bacterium]|nr:hypothetical protein [Mycobacteriales bacterium]
MFARLLIVVGLVLAGLAGPAGIARAATTPSLTTAGVPGQAAARQVAAARAGSRADARLMTAAPATAAAGPVHLGSAGPPLLAAYPQPATPPVRAGAVGRLPRPSADLPVGRDVGVRQGRGPPVPTGT